MKRLITAMMALALVFAWGEANACTNFLITKGASADGSCMISYAADSHVLYGELYHYPAADHAPGEMRDVYDWDGGAYLGQIPEVAHTYNVVGNMNEWQVAIGETTYGGIEALYNGQGIIDYGSLIYIALQRSKTAREAIKWMGELVFNYGYVSEGESFSICDTEECWILEMIGKGPDRKGAVWVARRIPDGFVSGHANQARITTFPLASRKCKTSVTYKNIDKLLKDPKIDCVYADDVISFAKEMKLYDGPDAQFSFSDVYNPVTFDGARFCDLRVWAMFNKVTDNMKDYWGYATGRDIQRAQPYTAGMCQTPANFPTNRMPLWVEPNRKVSVLDMMDFMRDHLEGTELDMSQDVGAGPFHCPYRWRPMDWEVDGVTYVHERTTATQQTGFSFVAQSRGYLERPIGGIIWFGVDDTDNCVYCPMYTCMTEIPECFREGNGSMSEWSETSAFWTFNQMSNWAYTKYNYIHPEIRKMQREMEVKWVENVIPATDKRAATIKGYDGQVLELTKFSCGAASDMTALWKRFYHELFMKYVDGNLNTAQPLKPGSKYTPIKSEHPKYSEEYYRVLIEKTGDKYKAY
ncbi:MAG: C69 family dipeptidase [Bacteroidales bacterium]|nr:C69 family dipeptidase [Bacteroidales bacterium]